MSRVTICQRDRAQKIGFACATPLDQLSISDFGRLGKSNVFSLFFLKQDRCWNNDSAQYDQQRK